MMSLLMSTGINLKMTYDKKLNLLVSLPNIVLYKIPALPSNILMGDKCVSIIKSKGSKNIYL